MFVKSFESFRRKLLQKCKALLFKNINSVPKYVSLRKFQSTLENVTEFSVKDFCDQACY